MLRGLKYYLSPNEGTGGSPPPAGAGNNTPPPTPPDTQDVASLPDWAQKMIRETREEAAKHRVNAKDKEALAAKLKEIEDAQLSEADKVKKTAQEATDRATALESQLRLERLTLAIEREATKLKIVDPETASLLIANKVEYDKEEKPTNVTALLTALVTEKPYLVGQTPTPGAGAGATNPSRGAGAQGATFTRAQIADRGFYEANRKAILQAMQEGRITN